MTTTGADAHADYCGALPGLSAAGARVACVAGDCPTEGICRALRRLDREAGLARASRDAAARYVDELLESSDSARGRGPEGHAFPSLRRPAEPERT